jgi:histidyl-tRNA synthetase
MKQAGRTGARFTLIIGEQELERHEGILRNMQNKEQEPFSLQGTVEQQGNQLNDLITTE